MTNLAIPRIAALSLAFVLFGSAAQAKAVASHSKKTAHKPAVKKAASGVSEDSSQWTPDAKLLSQLQPEQQFGPYSMRLPVGYTAEEHDVPSQAAHITAYFIKGPQRDDGSFPFMTIMVGTASPGYATGSADTLLDSNDALNGKPDLTKSDKQDGESNGLSFVRQYFKYRFKPDPSHWMHGFHYATTDGHTDVLVSALDVDPHNTASLPLAEAAALTLHRAQ